MDPDKVQAIQDWPLPQNLKDHRSFLGLADYYQRFIYQLASPLTDQLKKDNYDWNEAATAAFENLQRVMLTAPVLAIPNFSIPFVVEVDASIKGLRAVLSQNKHPIAYFSKALGVRGQAKSIYEKGLMVIVLAIQKLATLFNRATFCGLVSCWGMISKYNSDRVSPTRQPTPCPVTTKSITLS